MKTLRRIWSRGRTSMNGRDEERLRDEIEEHIALQTEEFEREGIPKEEARRRAMMKFGPVESIKEEYRDGEGLQFFENVLRDAKFSLRQMKNNPGFAWTAVLILAIGIAASVAIFAFVDAALLKPLPYAEPNRLVHVTESVSFFPVANLSYPDYLDWKERNHSFEGFDFYDGSGDLLSTASGSEVVTGMRASAGFFRTLGVKPILGRDFYDGEDTQNAAPVTLLSYGSWQKRFGGRRDVIGETVTLSGTPTTIIGVLPKEFQFAPVGEREFWKAFRATNSCDKRRSCHSLYGVARLKPGVSVEQARAEMKGIAAQLEREYPDSNKGQGASVLPLADVVVGDLKSVLLMLLAGASLLLVIACVNVASLLLVRSERRKREINIRGALGASPARLFLQFASEGAVLVLVGAVAGVLLAHEGIRLLMGLISKDMLQYMPFLNGIGINTRVILFAVAISAAAILLFSIVPLVRLPRRDLREGMESGSRGSAGWKHFGGKLVIIELATAVVLLVGAALLGESFYRMLHAQTGFDTSHLALLRMVAPDERYGKNDDTKIALQRRVVKEMEALPGVKSAALANSPALNGNGNTTWIRVAGHPYNGEHNETNEREVSSEYFATLGARLLRGRAFGDAEDKSKPKVVVINETLAKKHFANEDPIGQKLGDTSLSPDSMTEIIGVVDDIREGQLDSEIMPAVYYPINQQPRTNYAVIVRTEDAEQYMPPEMVKKLREIDPSIAAFAETTMYQKMRDSQTAHLHRSAAWLVAGFAALALLLGSVGLYGVIAYSVSQRTREIGVRMALGAERGAVYRMILGEAGTLTVAGIVAGLIGAAGAVWLMKKMLYGIKVSDASMGLMVALVLGAAALFASWLPARKAASVSPVEALRVE